MREDEADLPAVRSESAHGLDWKGLWDGVKRVAGHLDGATQTSPDDVLVGKIGIVTARVATGITGEIRVPIRGGTQDYIACAQAGRTETMEVNSTAEVVAFVPPNTVFVKPPAIA